MYKICRDICDDQKFIDYIEDLLKLGRIDNEISIGITKMVVEKRGDELSEKQWNAFKKYVVEPNFVESCTACAESVPWCEMLEAVDNGGYCSWCSHMIEKRERE